MKVLIAPDKFKGSLKAGEVARAIQRGLQKTDLSVRTTVFPIADGGEGTVETLTAATGGRKILVEVTGPLGSPVKSFFGLLGSPGLSPSRANPQDRSFDFTQDRPRAVIEMAAASGLTLVPPQKRNPMITTTYGTGELIKAALDAGSRWMMVGIGDSATVDGGVGMAQALGAKILDGKGAQVGFGGGELSKISQIDLSQLDSRLKQAQILVACDVDNSLTGPRGAARVFGPQKGATPEQVEKLELGLRHLAEIVKRKLGLDVLEMPGAGAAGGLGAGLVAFLGAKLKRGPELIMEVAGFRRKLKGVDLVVTGEGRMDAQTLRGKTPMGVAQAAREAGAVVVAIVGQTGPGFEGVYERGISKVYSLMDIVSTEEEAMKRTAELVEAVAQRVMKDFLKSEN